MGVNMGINRIRARRAVKGKKGWCDGCDANIVGNGEKCSVCGHQQGKRRLKKQPDVQAEVFGDEKRGGR